MAHPRLDPEEIAAAAAAGLSVREAARRFGVTSPSITYWKKKLGLRFRPACGTDGLTDREATDYRILKDNHGYRRDEALAAIGRHDLRAPAAPSAGKGPAAPDTPTATAGPTVSGSEARS